MEHQLAFDPAAPTSVLAGAWVVVGLALSIFIFLIGYLCGQASKKDEDIPTATVVKDEVDDDYKKDVLNGEAWKRGTIYEQGIDDEDDE